MERIHPFALLALRGVLGIILLAHALPGGLQTLSARAHSVVGMGWMATLIWGVELVGGAALVLGAATRFFATVLLIDMLVAIVKVSRTHGLAGAGGSELPLALATMAFAVAVLGAGPISMDWLFARKKGF